LYTSPNLIGVIISTRMRYAGDVACMGEMRNVCLLSGKSKEKRPLGGPRYSWADNIKETGSKGADWILLAHD
jgi:hypothetical protein